MITINKNTCAGKKLSISDEKVYVDGKLQEVEGEKINIFIESPTHSITVDKCDNFYFTGFTHRLTVNNGNVNLKGEAGNITINNGKLITPESEDEITDVNKVYLDIQTVLSIISSVENNTSLLINDVTLERLALGFELGKQTSQLLVAVKKLQELAEQFNN